MEETTSSYRRFLKILRGKGYRKLPSETPQEFAGRLGPPRLRETTQEFTRVYNEARYGRKCPSILGMRELLKKVSAASGKENFGS